MVRRLSRARDRLGMVSSLGASMVSSLAVSMGSSLGVSTVSSLGASTDRLSRLSMGRVSLRNTGKASLRSMDSSPEVSTARPSLHNTVNHPRNTVRASRRNTGRHSRRHMARTHRNTVNLLLLNPASRSRMVNSLRMVNNSLTARRRVEGMVQAPELPEASMRGISRTCLGSVYRM